MKITPLVLLALLAGPAAAEGWHCRNPDLEVSCGQGRCLAAPEGTFTPMDIAFDDAGNVSACVYSGCWDGQGQVSGDGRYLVVVLRGAQFSPALEDPPRQGDLALLFDRELELASFQFGGYVQPLACRATGAGAGTDPVSPSAP